MHYEEESDSTNEEIEKINAQIKDIRNSNLSAFRQNRQVDKLNKQKQNILDKKKGKEDDDLTITY